VPFLDAGIPPQIKHIVKAKTHYLKELRDYLLDLKEVSTKASCIQKKGKRKS